MNPLELYKPSTSTVPVLLAAILSVLATGCTDDPPTAPSTASGPPPITVNWEKLPYKMLVTQREYKAGGRIGKIWLLDPLTRTCSVVLQSDIYEFRDLRVDHATSSWYFVSDRFSDGGWPKVRRTSAQGGFSQVSYTPEGEPRDLAVSRSGQVAFGFNAYSGWGPNTKSGIWVGSDLSIRGNAVDFGGHAWADETHLLVSRMLATEQGLYRISVPDKSESLVFSRHAPPLAAKTTDKWATVRSPEVSANGDCIAFQIAYNDQTGRGVHSLWTIHGQDTTEILSVAGMGLMSWKSRFSPDGRYIAVDKEDGNIWILGLDGSGSACVITAGWIWSFDWP